MKGFAYTDSVHTTVFWEEEGIIFEGHSRLNEKDEFCPILGINIALLRSVMDPRKVLCDRDVPANDRSVIAMTFDFKMHDLLAPVQTAVVDLTMRHLVASMDEDFPDKCADMGNVLEGAVIAHSTVKSATVYGSMPVQMARRAISEVLNDPGN